MIWNIILLALTGAVVAVIVAMVYGYFRWQKITREIRSTLEATRIPIDNRRYSDRELDGLPQPVQRYFRTVLENGVPIISALSLKHCGTFNMSESGESWWPFVSDQKVVTQRPGFDWNGKIKIIPGLAVRVHDAYITGEGVLLASLSGAIPLATLRGTPEMAQGELMRYLAEAAWYPTALLPSQGVQWSTVDQFSANATLIDGNTSVTLLFHFNSQGMIESVHAKARGRMVAGEIVPTPWEGQWSNYERHDGIYIPTKGEVKWILPEGAKPYWRAHLTEICYG